MCVKSLILILLLTQIGLLLVRSRGSSDILELGADIIQLIRPLIELRVLMLFDMLSLMGSPIRTSKAELVKLGLDSLITIAIHHLRSRGKRVSRRTMIARLRIIED